MVPVPVIETSLVCNGVEKLAQAFAACAAAAVPRDPRGHLQPHRRGSARGG
eukprot:COSAG01_NODE_29335_length_640_cov_0.841035_2_plen_50_part_01